MLFFIALTGGIGLIGSWFSNDRVMFMAVLMMLHFIAVQLNEGIRALREMRDDTKERR